MFKEYTDRILLMGMERDPTFEYEESVYSFEDERDNFGGTKSLYLANEVTLRGEKYVRGKESRSPIDVVSFIPLENGDSVISVDGSWPRIYSFGIPVPGSLSGYFDKDGNCMNRSARTIKKMIIGSC